MKHLTAIIILAALTACSNNPHVYSGTVKADSTALVYGTNSPPIPILTEERAAAIYTNPTPFLTGNDLVDRIKEIKELPTRSMRFNGSEIDSISWSCGDSLYWKIVALGKEGIPFLIEKVLDNSSTDIKIPCRGSNVTEGTIAFMALEEIISIPFFTAFEMQYDVFEVNCDFGYPAGLLESINDNPKWAHDKLLKWYNKHKLLIKKTRIKPAEQTICQKKYGINYKLEAID